MSARGRSVTRSPPARENTKKTSFPPFFRCFVRVQIFGSNLKKSRGRYYTASTVRKAITVCFLSCISNNNNNNSGSENKNNIWRTRGFPRGFESANKECIAIIHPARVFPPLVLVVVVVPPRSFPWDSPLIFPGSLFVPAGFLCCILTQRAFFVPREPSARVTIVLQLLSSFFLSPGSFFYLFFFNGKGNNNCERDSICERGWRNGPFFRTRIACVHVVAVNVLSRVKQILGLLSGTVGLDEMIRASGS